MKISTALVLYLAAMAAPSILAAPLRRCPPGDAGMRCIGRSGDHALLSDPPLNGGNALAIHTRGLPQTLLSLLAGLPILGPILAPLLKPVFDTIGQSEVDVASASNISLDAEQIATLATFEFALSNAVHKVLLSSGSPEGGAQSKLKTRDVFPLASVVSSAPLVGAFLQPVVPLLETLRLDSMNVTPTSAFSTALLNEDQSAKLVQFQSILQEELKSALPNVFDSTPSDAPLPSKSSPEEVKASPTSSPDASEDEDADPTTPSPDNASPADVPFVTPLSSPAPK